MIWCVHWATPKQVRDLSAALGYEYMLQWPRWLRKMYTVALREQRRLHRHYIYNWTYRQIWSHSHESTRVHTSGFGRAPAIATSSGPQQP